VVNLVSLVSCRRVPYILCPTIGQALFIGGFPFWAKVEITKKMTLTALGSGDFHEDHDSRV
jgi:hypothetical protein